MATKLLNQRIKDVMCARKRAGKADITPTLVLDLERTHILYVNAHFKPFAAIGYEYNKVRSQSGTRPSAAASSSRSRSSATSSTTWSAAPVVASDFDHAQDALQALGSSTAPVAVQLFNGTAADAPPAVRSRTPARRPSPASPAALPIGTTSSMCAASWSSGCPYNTGRRRDRPPGPVTSLPVHRCATATSCALRRVPRQPPLLAAEVLT